MAILLIKGGINEMKTAKTNLAQMNFGIKKKKGPLFYLKKDWQLYSLLLLPLAF